MFERGRHRRLACERDSRNLLKLLVKYENMLLPRTLTPSRSPAAGWVLLVDCWPGLSAPKWQRVVH
jgi:hypothetical protein